MKKENKWILPIIVITGTVVFIISLTMLFLGDELDRMFNVIGIRVVALFLAFASFLSSMLFSLLILIHNKTVVKINDDTNKRAELFRELQFASSNYTIIDFVDRMLIYPESERYIDKMITQKSSMFHMLEEGISIEDVYQNKDNYQFITVRIPFRVVEGKIVSAITFDKLRFERDGDKYEFYGEDRTKEARAFILYNERTKRNNVIMNLVMHKSSNCYRPAEVNRFTKIKIFINITSLLGVKVEGNSELYFSNPEQIEGDNTNTYAIHSSNFLITDGPKITNLSSKI
ncbi:hypothetical protein N7603_02330 [Acholeplasma vituli]|uniref:Uncharacterized protein n=1 Tax=Paracholeplasma vituli TaxID=69473 RepID=A0ABT2PXQ6_9MOLU|nr:hypothetical protein [Paracholeplasma vituli]MCU0104492.1 hypothetical protein [Paracholeplasma vituli]